MVICTCMLQHLQLRAHLCIVDESSTKLYRLYIHVGCPTPDLKSSTPNYSVLCSLFYLIIKFHIADPVDYFLSVFKSLKSLYLKSKTILTPRMLCISPLVYICLMCSKGLYHGVYPLAKTKFNLLLASLCIIYLIILCFSHYLTTWRWATVQTL